MRSTPTYNRVATTQGLTLDHSRIAHVMRIGKAQLETDAKTFIDEAARLERAAAGGPTPEYRETNKRGAESMRAMASEFQRYVDEASETILMIETACEYGPGQVAIVATDIHDLDEVKVAVDEALAEGG